MSEAGSSASEYFDPYREVSTVRKYMAPSSEKLKMLRYYSLNDISKLNARAEMASQLFHENRIRECEQVMEAAQLDDPLMACGLARIAMFKAALSAEQADYDIALAHANYAHQFAGDIIPKDSGGALSRVSGLWGGGKKNAGTNALLLPFVFRARVVHAEASALRACVLVLKGTMNSLVKGGLALRSSYNTFEALDKELQQRRDELQTADVFALGLDESAVGALLLGIGLIHMLISTLPLNIVKVLHFFGFKHDRAYGIQCLQQCVRTRTLSSPLAVIQLMVSHTVLPTLSGILLSYTTAMRRNFSAMADEMPILETSMLNLWLKASMHRLDGDVQKGTALLRHSMSLAREQPQVISAFPQLYEYHIFDLAWTSILAFNWGDAAACFCHLEKQTKWSQMFYAYAQGCCCEMLALEAELKVQGGYVPAKATPSLLTGDSGVEHDETLYQELDVGALREAATHHYWRAAHHMITRLDGKVIYVEEFVMKRLEEMLRVARLSHPNRGHVARVKPIRDIGTHRLGGGASSTAGPSGTLRNTVIVAGLELILVFSRIRPAPTEFNQRVILVVDSVLPEAIARDPATSDIVSEALGTDMRPPPKTPLAQDTATSLPIGYNVGILLLLRAIALAGLDLLEHPEKGAGEDTSPRGSWSRIFKALVDARHSSSKTSFSSFKSHSTSWFWPYTLFEFAELLYLSTRETAGRRSSAAATPHTSSLDECKHALKDIRKIYDNPPFSFQYLLQFREHLASFALRTLDDHE